MKKYSFQDVVFIILLPLMFCLGAFCAKNYYKKWEADQLKDFCAEYGYNVPDNIWDSWNLKKEN